MANPYPQVRSIAFCLAALAGCSASDGDPDTLFNSASGGAAHGGNGQGGSSSNGGSGQGGGLFDGGVGSGGGGGGNSSCASGAEWVYLLDSDETLLQFRPDTLSLSVVGKLSCPSNASPFSMSVDRSATAWVLYGDGNIFHVNTATGACSATAFTPNQSGLNVFGMGFVADAPGSNFETLFVAGGVGVSSAMNATLARLNTSSLAVGPFGQVNGWPELTGTGEGNLWAFAPDTNPPSISQIDKNNGNSLISYPLQALSGANYTAWAFAFWGGQFYAFLNDSGSTTNIWRYDPATANLDNAVPNTGYRIVGAGVSTCAPVIAPK